MIRWIAARWREWVLVLLSLAGTYFILEIGYRVYQYRALPRALFEVVTQLKSAGGPSTSDRNMFDANTGYRYTPNFMGQYGHPWHSSWRTNSHGHVSRFEYSKQKPLGEYRIAVVGDSMTANLTNNVRWTEVLEEQLNSSRQWRHNVKGQSTRVINFGLDGAGMVQFSAIVEHHVIPFEPDLIIVNFISDSFLRRLRYHNIPYQDGNRDENIRRYVRMNYLDRINWLSFRPELFIATFGQFWGMRSFLPIEPKTLLADSPDFRFATRQEAISANVTAVRAMLQAAPNILFLQMPLIEELEQQPYWPWTGLVEDFQRAVPEFNYFSMKPAMDALLEGKRIKDRPNLAGLNRFQILALPPEQQPEHYLWFFLPQDHHYNDYGTSLYAQEVAKFLIDRMSSPQ